MYLNLYALEQDSRQIVSDRRSEARKSQKARLAVVASRKLRSLIGRPAGAASAA